MNGGSDLASIPSDLHPLWMIVRLPADSSAAINSLMVAAGSFGTILPKVMIIGFSPAPRNSTSGRGGGKGGTFQKKKTRGRLGIFPLMTGLIAYTPRKGASETLPNGPAKGRKT